MLDDSTIFAPYEEGSVTVPSVLMKRIACTRTLLDPSTRKRDRNAALYGTGKWARVLIDATMNLDYDPDPDFGGARFPPLIWPSEADRKAAHKRWKELGLTPLAPSARR